VSLATTREAGIYQPAKVFINTANEEYTSVRKVMIIKKLLMTS
jgi:hypothetical protein